MTRPVRVLFVNSGLLGHRSVAALLEEAAGTIAPPAAIESRHIDAGLPRHLGDRILRRLVCASIAPTAGPLANADLARWRCEWHTGLSARNRLREVTRTWRPDVLLFHTQASAYGSVPLMRQIPSIVSIDCTQTLARQEMTGAIARASYGPNIRHDGVVFGAARAIVATSRWAAQDLRRTYPESAGRVRVMPYPAPLGQTRADWIEERHAASGRRPCRFLFMGADFPRKGGFDLLEAWRQSGLAGRAELQIVTGWPIRGTTLPDAVTLTRGVAAYSDTWRECWRLADVFVMPTRAEAFGMVFQEAAAAGVPAIATAINAIPELIERGHTGLLVPPADPGALVAAMRLLASDPDLRRQMGRSARERAASEWSLDRYARELASLVRACVSAEMAAT